MTKIGTLAEIGAKPGDVVADEMGYNANVVMHDRRICVIYDHWDEPEERNEYSQYRIVSRAPEKQDTKIGTLAELNVKPGDVVEFVPTGNHHTVLCCKRLADTNGAPINYDISWDCVKTFRIVSRAEATPKLWRDMTPEEKGALLLAHHEGKVIEIRMGTLERGEWRVTCHPSWKYDYAYRIKHEPKVETVTLTTAKVYGWISVQEDECGSHNTHRITFNLIDGEPDCTSIKMEKL